MLSQMDRLRAQAACTHKVLVHFAQQLHAVRLHDPLDALQQIPHLRRLRAAAAAATAPRNRPSESKPQHNY